MDLYRVRLTARAYRDLDQIFAYISEELKAPENAKGKTDRLWEALRSLDTFPQAHQERAIGKYSGRGYRQLIIDNYIAIFRIDMMNKIVNVITIQYKGRNL